MFRKRNRILTKCLALLLCFSLLPSTIPTAFAAEPYDARLSRPVVGHDKLTAEEIEQLKLESSSEQAAKKVIEPNKAAVPNRERFSLDESKPDRFLNETNRISNREYPFEFKVDSIDGEYVTISLVPYFGIDDYSLIFSEHEGMDEYLQQTNRGSYQKPATQEYRSLDKVNSKITVKLGKEYSFSLQYQDGNTAISYDGFLNAVTHNPADQEKVIIKTNDVVQNAIDILRKEAFTSKAIEIANIREKVTIEQNGVTLEKMTAEEIEKLGFNKDDSIRLAEWEEAMVTEWIYEFFEMEPNNYYYQYSYAQADAPGYTFNNYGTISPANDVDWWNVGINDTGMTNFWLGSIPPGCDYELEIYDSGLNLVGRSTNGGNANELVTFYAYQSERYYMKVFPYQGFNSNYSYLLRVHSYENVYYPDPYEPNNYKNEATVADHWDDFYDSNPNGWPVQREYYITDATIHEQSDVDLYKVTCYPGEFQIDLWRIDSGCDYDLVLYDSNMRMLKNSNLGGNSSEYIYYYFGNYNYAPQTFYIEVCSFSGCSDREYRLAIAYSGLGVVEGWAGVPDWEGAWWAGHAPFTDYWSINVGGWRTYEFYVPQSGMYSIYTVGNTDTYGELYDDWNNFLAYDDDAGSGNNFRMDCYLEGGQYYWLGVRHYSRTGSGNYELYVDFQGTIWPPGDPNFNYYTYINVPASGEYGYIYPGQWTLYSFTAPSSGDYYFYSGSSIDTYGVLYDSWHNQLVYDDDAGGNGQFGFAYYLNAGQTYYVAVRCFGQYSEGPFWLYVDYWGSASPLPTNGWEVMYEPWLWTNDSYTQNTTNCYAYALNLRWNPLTGYYFDYNGINPGQFSGQGYPGHSSDPEVFKQSIVAACIADANAINGTFTSVDRYDICQPGTYKVALVLAPGYDYHWYRQNYDGTWSHKISILAPSNVDFSGNEILDPEAADRNGTPLRIFHDYWYFAGYYAVSPVLGWSSTPHSSLLATENIDILTIDNTAFEIDSTNVPAAIHMTTLIEKGMAIDEVHEILGLPQYLVGSGIISDGYDLEDGSQLIINYGVDRDYVQRAKIRAADGSETILID